MMITSAKTMTVVPQRSQFAGLSTLWILTAASPQLGFGHLRRCLVIAEALRDYCLPVFVLDPDDCWSKAHLEDQNFSFFSDGGEKAWEFLTSPAAILIDSRLSIGLDRLIGTAKSRRIPVISIHDLGLNMLPSDQAIDGSIVPLNPELKHPETKYFTGADYMVLDPIYRILALQNKVIHEKVRSIYINLGGSNSGKFYRKVLEGLKLWDHEADVIGVPGFVSWGQELLAGCDWSPLHFQWKNHNFEGALFNADLAITAGGISAYEAICAGTPLLALSYDHLQQRTIAKLSDLDACIDLGLGDELEPERLGGVLARIDTDFACRQRIACNGRKIVDGLGSARVARIIRQSISASLTQLVGERS
jgi:spore coat polysaccharide biosynthesis predicted glycosyltransferase SpsG